MKLYWKVADNHKRITGKLENSSILPAISLHYSTASFILLSLQKTVEDVAVTTSTHHEELLAGDDHLREAGVCGALVHQLALVRQPAPHQHCPALTAPTGARPQRTDTPAPAPGRTAHLEERRREADGQVTGGHLEVTERSPSHGKVSDGKRKGVNCTHMWCLYLSRIII